jgi:cytochrome c1
MAIMLPMRIAPVLLFVLYMAACSAWGQDSVSADDVRRGRDLAIIICANCHVVARDQPNKPILKPPAPSFESIARHKTINSDWVKTFLTTTHRGPNNPNSMPNPDLIDSHAKQVAAYLLSLHNRR